MRHPLQLLQKPTLPARQRFMKQLPLSVRMPPRTPFGHNSRLLSGCLAHQSLANRVGRLFGLDLAFTVHGASAIWMPFAPDQISWPVFLRPTGVIIWERIVMGYTCRQFAGAAKVKSAMLVFKNIYANGLDSPFKTPRVGFEPTIPIAIGINPTFAPRPQKPHYFANKAQGFCHKHPFIFGFRGFQMLL